MCLITCEFVVFVFRDFQFLDFVRVVLRNTEMSNNHTVVYVNRLIRPVPLPPVLAEAENNMRSESLVDIYDGDTTECRICQEECDIKTLESPCSCNGSLKVVSFSFRKLLVIKVKLRKIVSIDLKPFMV